VTYNFDPDQWYENERAALELRYREGHLNQGEFQEALSRLETRYENMVKRLDGTYQLPKEKP
jgi:hypothetical protein